MNKMLGAADRYSFRAAGVLHGGGHPEQPSPLDVRRVRGAGRRKVLPHKRQERVERWRSEIAIN